MPLLLPLPLTDFNRSWVSPPIFPFSIKTPQQIQQEEIWDNLTAGKRQTQQSGLFRTPVIKEVLCTNGFAASSWQETETFSLLEMRFKL